MALDFKIKKKCLSTSARAGYLNTRQGTVETPVFMPVGTLGSVKTVSPRELEEIGAGIILANTYHLYLRPGIDVIEQGGGAAFFYWMEGNFIDRQRWFSSF